jgi:hypothetical protein
MARSAKDEALDLIKSGLATKAANNLFGKRVRNVDQDPMDVNDEFTIPADYEVLLTSINGSDPTPFILIPLSNPVTGITRNFRFFPNMLAKTIYPIVNGKRENKVKTVGSAALEYQKFADQGDEGMDNAVKALVVVRFALQRKLRTLCSSMAQLTKFRPTFTLMTLLSKS